MNYRKTSVKVIGTLLVLVSLFAYVGFNPDILPGNHTTWSQYAGGPDQSKYFETKQITKKNVNQLKVAWTYADSSNNNFSPIVVDTVMYMMAKNSSLVALSARTGKEIWIHANLQGLTRRGINYWESKDKKDKRLVFTLNNSIQEIDAMTGKSVMTFGTNGYVDMREGLDREPTSIRRMQSMMPGVIYDDILIIGSAPGEGFFSPPGHVRGYNVVTGKKEWTFHTVPHPGEYGYDTWPKDAYKYVGGTNVWGEISIDAQRGIAYLPIGSPTYDYYGADRLGANLFGNCLVAVDARTGKRLWHFQTVHHDLWDYDLTSAPQLITVTRNKKKIDAVAIATKSGFMFVFDRVTGEPVFPIEEKPFPPSEMPGEQAWPTQPIPTLPSFVRHEVTKETLNPLYPNPYINNTEKEAWYKRIDAAKSGLYIPLSDKYEVIAMPGALGGANFGNSASNPTKGIVYLISHEHGSVYKLNRIKPPQELMSADDLTKAKDLYASTCATCHGDKMQGNVAAPDINNAGQRITFDDFKTLLAAGKGRMPGFAHIEETRVTAIYRYLGGNPNQRFGAFGNRRPDPQMPPGPVVASGGAPIPPDATTAPALTDYPADVDHPKDRYTTDYGTNWSDMLGTPWSWIMAYDLNTGTIKWKQPIGEDLRTIEARSKGIKDPGAVDGGAKKGIVVTSTGVIFCNGKGGKVYALDEDTGKILWETSLTRETNGQPIMYKLDGKEYLAINATSNFNRDTWATPWKPGKDPRGIVVYSLSSKK